MKKITAFLVLYFFAQAVHGQDLSGHWDGYINVQGQQLIIKTHFMGDDSLRGTIDIPQQAATGLPLQKISVTDADSVFFEFMAGPGSVAEFVGAFRNDSTIAGNFHQNGQQFPFELKRVKPETEATTKQAPLPYHYEDLIIKNDSIDIGGTLTWPKNKHANQLVIMISGSGAQDRDESMQPVTDFKPFAMLADSLTINDIATFRFDDRGVGESTGNFGDATLDILAEDVNAIISDLSNRKEHNFEKIILLGHSQGGAVAGRVAAENEQVDKLILMASTGVPLREVLRFQVRQAFQQAGLDSTLIEDEIAAREKLMQAIKNNEGIEQAKERYQHQFLAIQLAAGADSAQAQTASKRQTAQLTAAFRAPQTQSLLFYDPTSDLNKLDIPVLVLFGSKDTQVTVEMNKEPVEKALKSADIEYRTRIFEEANHLFQKATTGNVQEYGSLDSNFVGGFLQTIEEWIKK